MQDLSLHVLDVAENGIKAGAGLVEIEIIENPAGDRLEITIKDNGSGMDAEFLAKCLDPFTTTRTTRPVGMGLSMFKQTANEAGGDLNIESTQGKGTTVRAFMSHGHIDRRPMGRMDETILTLIEGNSSVDIVYSHKYGERIYELDTREIRSELGDIPLNDPAVIGLIKDNITEGLYEIKTS
jgi:hypothetical protein